MKFRTINLDAPDSAGRELVEKYYDYRTRKSETYCEGDERIGTKKEDCFEGLESTDEVIFTSPSSLLSGASSAPKNFGSSRPTTGPFRTRISER